MVSALLFSKLRILKVRKLTLEKRVRCCVLKEQGLSVKDISWQMNHSRWVLCDTIEELKRFQHSCTQKKIILGWKFVHWCASCYSRFCIPPCHSALWLIWISFRYLEDWYTTCQYTVGWQKIGKNVVSKQKIDCADPGVDWCTDGVKASVTTVCHGIQPAGLNITV